MQKMSPIGWALQPLKRYAQFSGRASRAEFWWFFLFTMIVYALLLFSMGRGAAGIANAMSPGRPSFGSLGAMFALVGIFWLLFFIPTLAVQVRRLHDTNRSGWWIGAFWLLYLINLALSFGVARSAPQTPGAAPDVAGFAAVGIFALVFFIYSIVVFVFFCLGGTRGPNRFGDDPYGANVEEVFA